jgi:hypothetical protein
MSVKRVKRVLLVAFVLSGLAWAADATAKNGQGKPQQQTESSVPFTVLDIGQFSGVDTAQNVTIKDDVAWNALWAQHAGGTPPPVDFSKNIVVAVFLGQRASTAFSVRIDFIEKLYATCVGCDDLFDYGVVYVEEELQGKHCVFSSIITTPFVIAEVARPVLYDIFPDAMPAFYGSKVIVECKGGRKRQH